MVNVEFFGPLRYYTTTRRAEVTVNHDATIKDLILFFFGESGG